MATLAFDGVDDLLQFTPTSAELGALPNGAGTIVVLVRIGDNGDVIMLQNGSGDWYHGISREGTSQMWDDDGQSGSTSTATTWTTSTASADNYRIVVTDWPSGGVAPRKHWSGLIGSAESWTHSASGNSGGNRTGPGTSGKLNIGTVTGGQEGPMTGEIALIGIWAGVRLSDSDVEALWVNKKTSDWYNHSAGTPTTLIECTSTTPTDIGAYPSTFSVATAPTLTGADPTGWTFDGTGVELQTVLPDADTTTTGWTSTPLWSKVNDASDASIIQATLS